MITPQQIKAARALLDWDQDALAGRAGLSKTGLANIESGKNRPTPKTLEGILRAFDEAGIEFTDNMGVRQKSNLISIYKGKEAIRHLFDDIYFSMEKSGGGDIATAGADEKYFQKYAPEVCELQFERIQKLKTVVHRAITVEGDDNFYTPYVKYKWVKKHQFFEVPFYVYHGRIAMVLWEPDIQVVIIRHGLLAQSFLKQFNIMWDMGKEPRRVYVSE